MKAALSPAQGAAGKSCTRANNCPWRGVSIASAGLAFHKQLHIGQQSVSRRVSLVAATASSALAFGQPDGRPDWRPYQQELLGKMLSFMGPALLIPLGDPLMGLVDSITIGQFAGTRDLAALGPANMVFSFAIYIFQSLQVATLSLVGGHLRDDAHDHAAVSLGAGLRLALVAGLLSAAVLAGLHTHIIQATGVRDATLIEPAAAYLRTRAFAQPAVLLSMVAQSGMLAQQDSLTPCLSVMLTVAASLIANLIFVAGLGWGLQGAAITTVAAQYLGAIALLWALHRRQSKLKPNWQPPDSTDTWLFLRTMLPLTVVSMSKNTCYLIVQTTAATLRTVYLAAHQATFSVWALGTWSMSPIEQACLAYLPTAQRLWQRQAAAQLTFVMGVAAASLVGLLQLGVLCLAPGALVKDAAVQPVVASIGLQAALAQCLVGFDCCGNAVNIALRDFPWVARSYVITLASIAGYFTVCRSQGWGLGGVWWGLFLFFAVRAVQSLSRALWLLNAWPGQPPADPFMRVSLAPAARASPQPQTASKAEIATVVASNQGMPTAAAGSSHHMVPGSTSSTSSTVHKQAAEVQAVAVPLPSNGNSAQAAVPASEREQTQQTSTMTQSQSEVNMEQQAERNRREGEGSEQGNGQGNGGSLGHGTAEQHGVESVPSTVETVRNTSY